MNYKLTHLDDVIVVRLQHDLDMEDVVILRNLIASLLEGDCHQLVMDFSRVQHLNLTGMGILVEGLRRLRAAEGDLRLASVHPMLRQLLEAMGILKVFRVFPSAESAAASFQAVRCVAA